MLSDSEPPDKPPAKRGPALTEKTKADEGFEKLRADLGAIFDGEPDEGRRRAAILARVKEVSDAGRAEAERQLLAGLGGTACTEMLSRQQDDLIRAIHFYAAEFVHPPKNDDHLRMAVIATGGYGRGTLAPGSDIDLLFIAPGQPGARFKRIVEAVLYVLWDVGFKVGHATRSIDECIALARSDMTIRTAVLESRLITGDEEAFETLMSRFDTDVVRGTAAEFVSWKLAERDERHTKQGSSRYLVEPNIKEGKGGLRDLQTLFWIAKYVYRTDSMDQLVKEEVFSRAELRKFLKAEDFLWGVRCHLHFLTGRAEERLSFDNQRPMAERLGYSDRPGLANVERFMKHYFLVAKDVGDLTRIFSAELEERHVKQAPGLGRILTRRRKPKAIPGSDFINDNNRINIADEEAFDRDPVNLFRIFCMADRLDLAFHPTATHAMTRRLSLIDNKLRSNPDANKLFLDVLTSRRHPEDYLRVMNETGILGRFVPDFRKIVAMMQFSMYHHYTVDEHLLRTLGELTQLEKGDRDSENPLAAELVASCDRTVLHLAALFHDIAKGRPEDHSIAGARVVRKLGPRLGLTESQTDLLSWLVEHHLLMSTFAQRRDLQDYKTIHDFAAIVQDMDRLRHLLVLTVIDIRAVGPGVWNGWKGQLLRTLYWEAEPLISGGHSGESRAIRVQRARDELAEALSNWPEQERKSYVERHYPAYMLRVDMEHKLVHAELLREMDASGERMATKISILEFQAVTEITILAPDHPRLLSFIAGACAAAGANIVDAQIFTTVDGLALDTVFVSREFDQDEDEERRAGRICEMIEGALTGRVRLPERIATRGSSHRARYRPFQIDARIRIDNSWSNKYTAIEAAGLDRPGLLYDLTRALSDLNLNIGSAHITTYGERAVDVFYVTDLTGSKITSENRQAAIQKRLSAAFEPPEALPKRASA